MNFKNKKILITGGAGFIGSHTADALISQGSKVAIIDNLSTGQKENINPKAAFYKMNIADPKIETVFQKEKPEIVLHFAAQIDVRKSISDPLFDGCVNILGSLNVLENCRRHKIRKIVFASSGGAIYGEAKVVPTSEDCPSNPLSPYGIAKLAVEKYLNYYYKVFGLSFVSLRFANIYGPRQNAEGEAGVIAVFCSKMLSKRNPKINGSGRQTRDFVFVEDAVKASLLAIRKNKTGVFNIGTTQETSINEVFKKLKKLTNSTCRERHNSPKKGEQKRSCLSFSKAKKLLNWRPKYNLDKGLLKTVKWFENKIKYLEKI
jgi:UDP-glucose 4-epimerase